MKLKLLLFGLFSVFAFAFLSAAPDTVLGQTFDYTPLETIPGSTAADTKTFPGYVQGIYKFGIWAVGLAALFMLSIGGFIYLSSGGNTATISKAKTYIWDALIGLVLALLAWLILFVINPDLVSVNLGSFNDVGGTVTPTTQPSQSSGNPIPTFGATPQLPETSIAAKAGFLLNNTSPVKGVSWDMNADCSSSAGKVTTKSSMQETADGKQMTTCHKGCNHTTSLCNGKATMSALLLNALYGYATKRNINIISISGGSHSNTSKHYQGLAVDISVPGLTFQQARDEFNKLYNVGASPVIAYCDNGHFSECNVATHLHIETSRWK